MWFFDRGFAFRVANRFQTMDEFTGELGRFADTASDEPLDLIEQFDVLNQTVQSTDRKVQVGLLRTKCNTILNSVYRAMQKERKRLEEHGASFTMQPAILNAFSEGDRPYLKEGDLLTGEEAQGYQIRREHFGRMAVVLLVAFGVGMQVHLYAASYTAPSSNAQKNDKPLSWTKMAVIDEAHAELQDTKQPVIVEGLKRKLAHEVRNLAMKGTTD